MAVLTISAQTLDDYRLGGTVVKLRISPSDDFVTSLGKPVERDWYREVTCTIGSRVDGSGVTIPTLTIPAFTIDSTRDAVVNPGVTYTAYFYVDGINRGVYIDGFQIPATFSTGTTGTWDELIRYFTNVAAPRPDFTPYTRDELLRIIATLPAAVGVDASTSVKGYTKLSVAPASASNPIAVGDNDTRVADSSTSNKGVSKLSVAPASAVNPIAVGDNDTRLPGALGTANQLTGVNSGATGSEYKTLAVGTAGTNFAIAHTANTVTFNLPDASATARGVVTTGVQVFGGDKTFDGNTRLAGNATLDNGLSVTGDSFFANSEFSQRADLNAGFRANGGISNLFKGAAVASAAAIVPTGNLFHVTGTTTITSITATGIEAGTPITIIFDGVLTFTDGSNLKLAGNFVTTADDTITLVFDGTNWYEVCRSVN